MMAINILTAEFARRGFQINQLSDLDAIDQHQQNTPIVKMARLYVQMCAVNEAMATWWEAHLLKAMEFDATEYLYQKKANNPYIGQLNKASSANALNYIQNWHHKNYYQDSFSVHFMTSVSQVSTDKWGFLGNAED